MFKMRGIVLLTAAAFAFAAMVPANADGHFVLKAYQGFNFARGVVTKSTDPSADVSFLVNAGRSSTSGSAIGARKIKGFGSQMPGVAAFNDIAAWSASVNQPTPGYYVVQGHDGRTVYLVQVNNISDQSSAASKWELDVSWEKLW